MSVEALLTTSEVLSRSFTCENKPCIQLGRLKRGRSSIVCLRNGKSRRAGLPITNRKFAHCSRSPNELSRCVMLPRRICRAQVMEFPPGIPFSSTLEGAVLHVCRILHLELSFKPIVHILRCLDFRECMLPSPSQGLLRSRPSLCNLGRPNCRMALFARLLGRVLLGFMLFICTSLQPFEQLAAPAFAAGSPADVDVTTRESQDFYDVLFKKFEEKDDEMGRSQKQGVLLEKLRELHMKVKEKKERAEAAKRELEERHKSKINKQSLSPQEERVSALLDRTFQEFKEKLKGNVEAGSYAAPFGEDLRKVFNEKFSELQTLKNKASGLEKEAVLQKKVREFIDEIRVEERRLQAKALRDREEACKQMKAEGSQLKDNLARLLRRHLTLQEHLQASEGGIEVQLQELESEIRAVWERLLNVKAMLWQKEIGNLEEALVKLPSLEAQLEEGLWSALKDKSSASSAEESQQKETQEKVVNDLTKVLNNVIEHKFLPEAIDINPSEAKADEQILAFLDTLKAEEKTSKELLDTINKVVLEDIEAEKMNADGRTKQGSVVVAPGLQRLKAEKKAELKQFLAKNPEIGREFAARKQVQST